MCVCDPTPKQGNNEYTACIARNEHGPAEGRHARAATNLADMHWVCVHHAGSMCRREIWKGAATRTRSAPSACMTVLAVSQLAQRKRSISSAHGMPFKKVQGLVVLVERLSSSACGDVFAQLQDPTGHMGAIVSKDVIQKQPKLVPGCSIILQSVS